MATPAHDAGIGATPALSHEVHDDEGMDETERQLRAHMQAQATAKGDVPMQDSSEQAQIKSNRIADRETDYQKRRLQRTMTPARVDAYSMGDQTPDASASTYADTLRRAQLNRDADNTATNINAKLREERAAAQPKALPATEALAPRPRRTRWGDAPAAKHTGPLVDATPVHGSLADATPAHGSIADGTPGPGHAGGVTPGLGANATPAYGGRVADDSHDGNRWDATPAADPLGVATPKRSRWDATPAMGSATPGPRTTDATPGRKRSRCDSMSVLEHLKFVTECAARVLWSAWCLLMACNRHLRACCRALHVK